MMDSKRFASAMATNDASAAVPAAWRCSPN